VVNPKSEDSGSNAATEEKLLENQDEATNEPEQSDAVDEVSEGSEVTAEEVSEEKPEIEEMSEDESTPEEPAAEPEPVKEEPAPAPQEPARRGGFLPLFLGGVIAAALGAGATIYALPNLPPQLAAMLPLPESQSAQSEAALAAQDAKIEALTKELATLKAATPPAPDLSGVQTALDEANAAARALQDKVDALEGRVGTLEAQPPIVTGGVEGGAAQTLQDQIDALKAAVANAGASSVSQEEIVAAAAEAKAKIAAAEEQAAQLRADSEAAAKRAMTQAIAARISAAFDSGLPIAAGLADAEAAGITVPEVLKGDIPTLAQLQSSFPEAARSALVVSRKAEAGETLTDKLGAFLMAQTGARSIEPKEGGDADSVLSRAQADVDAGNLKGVLAEIAALPEVGKVAMADWVAQAQARLDAAQAVAELAQSVK